MSTTTAPKPTRKPAAKKAKTKPAAKAKRIKKPDQPRTLKKDRLVEMLRRPEGATIEEITEAFGILPHSARGMISTTGKRLGVKVQLTEGAYRLPSARSPRRLRAAEIVPRRRGAV